MRKIKVLHIVHSFGIGGLEKGISTLAQNASVDIEHIILCMNRSGNSQKLLPPHTRIRELSKSEGSSFSFIMRLAKVIRQENPDVVHTRNWGGVDGIIASRLAGVSNIVHGEHGWGMDDPHGKNVKRRFIRRWISLGVKEFTAVSKQIKTWLEQEVRVFQPVTQIYNGIDLSLYDFKSDKTLLKQHLGFTKSSLLIGAVGRLDPIKDHVGLIEVFNSVCKLYPESHLLIVGDGPERSRLENLKNKNVHLLGEREDIPRFMHSLDIFAMASLNEGISNTILEAMASRLPIVSTDVGGTPELIESGRNGFLVAAKDYSTFADRLINYLSDAELRTRHGDINYLKIKDKFTIPSMVSGYESVWRRVVRK